MHIDDWASADAGARPTLRTAPFRLDPDDYARTLVRVYFRRNRWSYLWFAALAVYGVVAGEWWLLGSVALATAALAAYRVWSLRRFAHDPENRALTGERVMELSGSTLRFEQADGSASQMPLAGLLRAERHPDHWLLYVSKQQFMHLPFAAFASDGDREVFEQELVLQGVEVVPR